MQRYYLRKSAYLLQVDFFLIGEFDLGIRDLEKELPRAVLLFLLN